LADGRCGGIDAQLEVEVKFGNKQVTMSLLILPGVVDPLVLGWNILKQVGTEIRCAGHEIIIPARNRHNGWLEEKLSVAVVQQVNELDDTTAFLEAELADFSTMTGTSNMAEHQNKMKDDNPIKQRYYPKNPKIQGEINAKVDELVQMGFIEHSKSPYSSPIVMVKKKTPLQASRDPGSRGRRVNASRSQKEERQQPAEPEPGETEASPATHSLIPRE